MSIFEHLSSIDISSLVATKGGKGFQAKYLPWYHAWRILITHYPSSIRTVYCNSDGLPYWESQQGLMVKVGITIEGQERISWLAVMDHSMRALSPQKATTRDVCDTIQRCSVKAGARHGLGISLWEGEVSHNEKWKALSSSPPTKREERTTLVPTHEKWKEAESWIRAATNRQHGLARIKKTLELYDVSTINKELLHSYLKKN